MPDRANDHAGRFDGVEDAIAAVVEPLGVAAGEFVGLPGREEPFPLDLLDAIRARLDDAPSSYVSRALAHRGENLQRRIAVVLPGAFDPDWIAAVREKAQVFRDQSAREAVRDAASLGDGLPGARIVGPVSEGELVELGRSADGDFVVFADRALEARWQQRVLGFGDAR